KALTADGHRMRTARMKAAAAGRRDQAGDVATRLKRRLLRAIRVWSGGDEELCVGMPWPLDHLGAWAAFDRLPGVHDQRLLGEVARAGDIVRDEEEGEALPLFEV